MKLHRLLPLAVASVLVVTPLRAQQPLPASTHAFRSTLARLETLSQSDFAEIISKAQSGDPEAQYFLALMYDEGTLVPKDHATALAWMLKSAEQGYSAAEDRMGEMYLQNDREDGPVREYADADRWLRLAARGGDAEAQFWLGSGYQRGWFGAVDYREAINWLQKAAAQGLPDAQFCLGQMYEIGESVPESAEVAASWFKKAADHIPQIGDMRVGGVWEAEGELAYMYRDGRLKGNNVEAYMWFAVVDSSLDPPINPAADDAVKQVAKSMTKAEIAEAQQRTKDWIDRHRSLSQLPPVPNR
jgi:TPR repeat protein